jgi:hypothetical protein
MMKMILWRVLQIIQRIRRKCVAIATKCDFVGWDELFLKAVSYDALCTGDTGMTN